MTLDFTLLLIAGLFVLLFFFGPFRAIFLRRRPTIEQLRCSGSNVSVVLIHGTFARNAKWTQVDKKLLGHVTTALGPCDAHRLLWSGDNCQSPRIAAVEVLVKWLLEQPEKKEIFLVGHSHGGLIASMAATRVDRRIQIVTLSTPFILVQTRHASLFPIRSDDRLIEEEGLLLFGVSLWLLAAVLALVSIKLAVLFIILAMPILWLVVGALGLQPWIDRFLHSGVDLLRKIGEATARDSLIQPAPATLLILRTPGDEASGALATVNLFSWAFTSVLRLIGSIGGFILWSEYHARKLLSFFSACGVFALPLFFAAFLGPGFLGIFISQVPVPFAFEIGIGMAFMAIAFLPVFLLLIWHIPYLLIAPALTLIAAILNFILTLPFGIDLAIRSSLVSVSAEPAPLGTWPVTIASSGKSLLAHSILYESSVIEYVLAELSGKDPN